MDHVPTPSGWCQCGHHRDDGRQEKSEPRRLNRAEIRALLAEYGPAYEPKDNR